MNVMIKGESEEYRKLRDQLLEAEIALKDQTERVAALRRKLPGGPLVETDYYSAKVHPIFATNPPRISGTCASRNSSLPARTA